MLGRLTAVLMPVLWFWLCVSWKSLFWLFANIRSQVSWKAQGLEDGTDFKKTSKVQKASGTYTHLSKRETACRKWLPCYAQTVSENKRRIKKTCMCGGNIVQFIDISTVAVESTGTNRKFARNQVTFGLSTVCPSHGFQLYDDMKMRFLVSLFSHKFPIL